MARKTVDLLPEIFRTDTNKKFLAATLDQLTQEPAVKKTYGWVGSRVGPGVNPADNYVVEPTATRTNYQLDPGVIFYKTETKRAIDAITYPGMIDALALEGANTQLEDRLFESEYYTWDPFCDLDKLVNYSQYYWLPAGPDSVNIGIIQYPTEYSWDVMRVDTFDTKAYRFSGLQNEDPTVTLVRGGTYNFNVNQTGNGFWIQTVPGAEGRIPTTPNISSRGVLGVVNNGNQSGTVTFNVPLKTAQDFYYTLTTVPNADLVSTTVSFYDLNNVYVEDFQANFPGGIDGITGLNGRTVIFVNQTPTDQDWTVTTFYDPLTRTVPNQVGACYSYSYNPYDTVPYETPTDVILSGEPDPLDDWPGSYDSLPFDQATVITELAIRYSVWQIQYITDGDGRQYMQVSAVRPTDIFDKFQISFGTQYSSTQWYKTAQGYFEQVPLLTAVLDTLYYQDSTSPEMFGRIRLVDPEQNEPLDVNEIIGARNYTSPNGVVFTNGLKVQFRGLVDPPEFQTLSFYVEGVGTGPGIDFRVGFIDGEAYFGPWHYYQNQKRTGSEYNAAEYQQNIYDTVAESLANPGAGGPAGAALPATGIAGATRGNGIQLIPVRELVTPEPYTRSATDPFSSTPYDAYAYDGSLNAPLVPDYLTINRAARDRNAWSRSNRWFHIDVINATAEYTNQVAVLDNNTRAKRPIVEVRAGTELYNFGTQGKLPVNIIDFTETDAFSNINGQRGYAVDGYQFITGTRVIFAADIDAQVRDRVFEVQFIDPNNTGVMIIDLVPVPDSLAQVNQTAVCLNGTNRQGQSFWYNGAIWILAQEKTSVNQAPLFNVRDSQGVSYADRSVYPSSTFTGSRLFGYTDGGTAQTDAVLGFALKYLNINNVGDILFSNYLYTDSFIYVRNNTSDEIPISQGFVRQYIDRTQFSPLIGWQTAAAENRSRQVFRFTYTGVPLVFDVPPAPDTVYPVLQLYIEGVFVDPTTYVITSTATTTTVTFIKVPNINVIIEAQLISNVRSDLAYYQVPLNLENNPLNENSDAFTLGTIRNHYNSIGQNLKDIQGHINGANNTRDLGDIIPYGTNIVQNSSPLTLTGVFLRRQQYELFNSLRFNGQEYEKYKSILLDLAGRGDYVNSTTTQILDQVLVEISNGKTEQLPFYWSDMIPSGETYIEHSYTYTLISTPVFDTTYVYNFTSSNYQGLLIYYNGNILTIGDDYTVGVDSPTVTITVPLAVGDIIIIREYTATYGSFVPNTPTKMGLYPAYLPQIFIDQTSINNTPVIQGHDGSITRAFGDYRDQVLLEFETRIFNNLKIKSPVPIDLADVLPGQFRTTDYNLGEVNQILSTSFLSWIGWNKLDYTTQSYLANNQFTWNYSQSANRLTGDPLPGNWRGIYSYFYDTIYPSTRPWEMLGFSQEPDWWQNEYGPAPYTSGNLVLWEDLAAGLVRDPAGFYVLLQYKRPDLLRVIPVDSEGNLLSPLSATVGNYDATSFRRPWRFGDDGPVENSWRSSSAWPFAVMRLLALTKPAKFFSLFEDRDRYVYDSALEQYLWDGRYRLNAKNLTPLYGNGTSKASYINWIIDYNRVGGNTSTADLSIALENIGVQLCWRAAAFTDKTYLKISTERGTPNSLNTGLILPDESYQILLYKNQAFDRAIYSSVIIQKTDTGWAVIGYSTIRPYFEIFVSRSAGPNQSITVGSVTAQINTMYTDNIVQVPYGYVFTTINAVADFLVSYGRLLTSQGFVFDSRENGYALDWLQMVREFLYWTQQGWGSGSMINLNPTATRLSITVPGAVAESIATPTVNNLILNQNRIPIPATSLVIDRLENTFTVTSANNNTINYIDLRFTSYENIIILDNVSIFADLIYQPVTGARQSRVRVAGVLSADWNGTVNAPGFVMNQDNVAEWIPNQKYATGEIVLFKNEYWSASTVIEPSQQFDYAVWFKSDYTKIQVGLLPNAANASDQLATSYSVYDANLEQEVDIFSYGLIGFRQREYMKALNLDDISQVGLYQQFTGTKGTLRSAELFTYANLDKETSQYDIYEYWAILKSQYGATANRNYVELLLNEAKFHSDPALIQVINPGEPSKADQTVLLQNVWKSSYNLTSPEFLPTTNVVVGDSILPSAGYVDLDDVDITMFSFDNPQNINNTLSTVGLGTTIWVAKINSYDWNVYLTSPVPGQIITVSDNLNGLALVTFNAVHGLEANDFLIIKYFDNTIDGIYRVRSVPGIYSVLIPYIFFNGYDSVSGAGLGFTLQSSRVAQPSDISSLSYAKTLKPGSKVWVDDNGQSHWTMLEKTDVFQGVQEFVPTVQEDGQRFGAAVAQGFRNLSALVGAPGYDSGAGGIFSYVKTSSDQYVQDEIIITLSTVDTYGFGSTIDIGNQTWAIAGAPESAGGIGYAVTIYRPANTAQFELRQLLVAPDTDGSTIAEFGYSATISQDEHWMYIGAPGENKVYAYGLQSVEERYIEYTTSSSILVYSFASIVGSTPLSDTQITVVLNNQVLVVNVDYQVTNDTIILGQIPANNQRLVINRRSVIQLDTANYNNVSGTVSPGGGTGATFLVNVVRGQYSVSIINPGDNYTPGDQILILYTEIGGSSPADDLVITVGQTGPTYSTIVNGAATQLTVSSTTGLAAGQKIYYYSGSGSITAGTEIVSVDSATQFTIDTPIPGSSSTGYTLVFFADLNPITQLDPNGQTGTGDDTTASFDVSAYLSTVSLSNIFSFTVAVNGVLYRPYIDYTYSSGIVTFDNLMPTFPVLGDSIIVSSRDYWDPIATLTPTDSTGTDRFGHSITTTTDGRQLIIGCPDIEPLPGETYTKPGKVYIYCRSVQRFQVTNASQLVYTTVETPIEPVAVLLNGEFLVNLADYLDGNYSLSGNVVTLSNSVSLTVGDTIEIETNQFHLVQVIESTTNVASYGAALDICVNNCSLYVGAPNDSTALPLAGSVEFLSNPSRVYGTTTSTVANPTLNVGNYLSINDVFVEVTGTSVADLISDIDAAIDSGVLPNVTVTATNDVTLISTGTTTVYNIGSIYSDASSYTTVVYVDDVLQTYTTDYTYNNTTEEITFVSAPVSGAAIVVVSGRIIFAVKNYNSAPVRNKLRVLPGTSTVLDDSSNESTVFDDLGFDTYVWVQTIISPIPQTGASFGKSVFISDQVTSLIIGAPNGSTIAATTFDHGTTYFDSSSTTFTDAVIESGAVYEYDMLPAANPSLTNSAKFVFGQQIYDKEIAAYGEFGTALNYTTGELLVGAPGRFNEIHADGTPSVVYGRMVQFTNPTHAPAWQPRRVQQPVVDINLLNTVFMYDRVSNAPKQYFDYFDPLQGRMLGAIAQNVDYTGAIDPAAYNVGDSNNYGSRWDEGRVGHIWWDTTNTRFIDPNQNDVVYASRRWGQVFPGSIIAVYQWVASPVPPVNYTGPGIPYSFTSYTVTSSVNEQGLFVVTYYFWLAGLLTVNQQAKKTLSTNTIAQYIADPRASGISYIAPINASTIAIYNSLEYIVASDTVLYVEFDQQPTENAVHSEFQLIPTRAEGFLNAGLYQKFQDSFCGADLRGSAVPDPFLTPSEKYGVATRPRQSMFANRFLALQNYLGETNALLANLPITEMRTFNLLNSAEPIPSAASDAWDKLLANQEELLYQDLAAAPLGYRYLVVNDSAFNGLWTIYQIKVTGPQLLRYLELIQVQTYDTKRYWSYQDWYLTGYNPSVRPVAEVANATELLTLTVAENSSVKVTANAQGKWEIYRYTNSTWVRVGLQTGTIKFSNQLWDYSAGRFGFDVEVFDAQYYDQEPTIETRKIIQAINQELFIDDLAIERNQLLVLMFNFILSEQQAPLWLTKTSLIDVDHTIRQLLPYQIYREDNQDFVLNYIQEVKPYHVQIRQFNLIYKGFDQFMGSLTDFDLPAYWDAAQGLFISPVLDNSGTLSTTSSVPSTSAVWQTFPWNQWYQNYLLTVDSVIMIDGGTGYTADPAVIITGDSVVAAELVAHVNSAGRVTGIEIISAGSGYSETPVITIVGNGVGARAYANMTNSLVRNIKTTIKYDRYQYQTNIQEWVPNENYDNGTQVRHIDRVWEASSDDSTGVQSETFDPQQWIIVPAGDLSGVDRTMGYYVATPNEPGLDLALLISGVDYPGVQVYGPNFDQDTGFDVGNFDINPYDNISYGPEGLPTYDPAILDAIYESNFVDPYLGVGPAAIDVDGGAFVDTYSSHAPEELVPGAIFDTLDLRVYTTPGADWQSDGHGFPLVSIGYQFTIAGTSYSFADLLEFPSAIRLFNKTVGNELTPLVDYIVDWVNQTVTVNSGVITGNTLLIDVYELGGGNQMYRNRYNGADIGDTVVVPIAYSLISEVVVFVNGVFVTDYTYSAVDVSDTEIVFGIVWTSTDDVVITVMGSEIPTTYSWSLPVTEYFVSAGELVYTLSDYLGGTNPANVIVEKNGVRARPVEGAEYIGDGSSLEYYLPVRGGYSQALIADNDVSVFVNNVRLTLGSQFTVTPYTGDPRTVILANLPPIGAEVLITVSTESGYTIVGNVLTFKSGSGLIPIVGDVISVTTWNDTAQQNILTQVFVGPETVGSVVTESYDTTLYDTGSITDDPGSYDFSVGTIIQTNRFDTGRIISNSNRIMVSLSGLYIYEGLDYAVDGTAIVISGPPIAVNAVVAITSFTQSVLPGGIAFRIWQDMRGQQSTYRITASTTTQLVSVLNSDDAVIYVDDAGRLSEPNLTAGLFGLITINGERITYRTRDLATNTLSGLRRGTAGTAAADHAVGSAVYDIGIGNLLPAEYQDRIIAQNFLGNGTETVFTATEISISSLDSTELVEAVEVYVGGIKQMGGYIIITDAPVAIAFTTAPTAGYQVSIRIRQGLSWYHPGVSTPSDGISLQDTNTLAARFIRGN
jgi:hypothetical protein